MTCVDVDDGTIGESDDIVEGNGTLLSIRFVFKLNLAETFGAFLLIEI